MWRGRANPSQETRLEFFEDGRGLLFYLLWGSWDDPPFVDQFTWNAVGEDRLEVTWQTRHIYEYPEDDNEDEHAPAGPAVLTVTSNVTEEIGYKLDGQSLEITIGMQDSEFTKLSRVGPAGDYDTEYWRLTRLVANLHPSGLVRRVWAMDKPGVWHRVVRETKVIFGIAVMTLGMMGQAAYLADYARHLMPYNLVVFLGMIPPLLSVFTYDGKGSGLIDRLATWIRSFAAGWYLALTTLVLVMLAKGYRPDRFIMNLAFIGPGTWYSLRVFLQRRH